MKNSSIPHFSQRIVDAVALRRYLVEPNTYQWLELRQRNKFHMFSLRNGDTSNESATNNARVVELSGTSHRNTLEISNVKISIIAVP